MTVCGHCSKYGSSNWTAPKEKDRFIDRKFSSDKPMRPSVKSVSNYEKKTSYDITNGFELIMNFGILIRKARKKMELSQVELGRLTREKVSLIKKIELGKITPDNQLSQKLEDILKIKLLVPSTVVGASGTFKSKKPTMLTIEDLVKMDKNKKEGSKKRRQFLSKD
jgi:putative transcription factor